MAAGQPLPWLAAVPAIEPGFLVGLLPFLTLFSISTNRTGCRAGVLFTCLLVCETLDSNERADYRRAIHRSPSGKSGGIPRPVYCMSRMRQRHRTVPIASIRLCARPSHGHRRDHLLQKVVQLNIGIERCVF